MAEQNILYKVVTKRDVKMMKSFVRFSYRQAHPKVSKYFMYFGLANLVLAAVVTIHGIRVTTLIFGVVSILMSLFRHWIPVMTLMTQDQDYTAQNELSYTFTGKDITCCRNGEEFLKVPNYSRVHHLYHDELYYYLGANEDNLMVLPKADFKAGDPDSFGDFIEKKAGITCHWSPDGFKERRKKEQAESIIRQENGRKMMEQQKAERDQAIKNMKKALKERREAKKGK